MPEAAPLPVELLAVLAFQPCPGKLLGDAVALHYALYAVLGVCGHTDYAPAQEFKPRLEQRRRVQKNVISGAFQLFRDIICNIRVNYFVEQRAFLLAVEDKLRPFSCGRASRPGE